MTMRDYKLVCPSYAMLVKGVPCEKCKGGRYYHCFLNKCTKGSQLKSLVNTAEMYLHHKILRIYDNIQVYVSPSKFLQNKVMEMGLNKKVEYLPNFTDIEKTQPDYEWQEESLVFVGRLSYEKGIETLISAVKNMPVKLKIIGGGPLKENLLAKIKDEEIGNVSFLGYLKGDELFDQFKKTMMLVIPSEWYENNPRTVIEAFALGKPVIGARIGGIPELVKDGETGYTFESGNTEDLREKINYVLNNKDLIPEMGKKARKFVEKELNPEIHYAKLMKIYQSAINKTHRKKN